MAVVTSSPTPLILLDGDLEVVVASRSFCDSFGIDPATVTGRPFFALGAGEWDSPEFRSLMKATASGAAAVDDYEMDFVRAGRNARRLLVQARRLVYLDFEQLRVLVAVADITQTRADETLRNDALRQNSVLLREVRHRVANSLQIVASVLLQNARNTQSKETRTHLHNAHHRVMSVAALERQLSVSPDGEVRLKAYFIQLCENISGSMIGGGDRITLAVAGGDGLVDSRVSVSLGLIVTELVINAIKHAFPQGGPGKIIVDYDVRGPNWVLSVTDNGVGMPVNASLVQSGLGTSIVQALAKQMEAVVSVVPAHPGVRISLHHTSVALAGEAPPLARPAAETCRNGYGQA